jgi:hypothetical protein
MVKMAKKDAKKSRIFSNTFFRAAVLTSVVFISGILVGLWMDTIRLGMVQAAIEDVTYSWNDAKMQNLYYQVFEDTPGFCEAAIEANLDFNEKIYREGLRIERYESVNKFTPSLLLEKKRYALLQFQFWANSIQLRDKCNTTYTTLVYLHSKNESFAIEQKVQSAVLIDVKEKCGNELMLIPLPADLEIETVDLVKSNFGVKTFPSILINETILLEGLQSERNLRPYIPCLQ